MASNADKHTKRSVEHCKKCRQPVRGHIGPHGSLCHQPSPQFLEDVPSLANIQEELEASIVQHQQDIANLTADLQLLQIHNSTPVSTANKPQMSSVPVSRVKTSSGPNGSLVFILSHVDQHCLPTCLDCVICLHQPPFHMQPRTHSPHFSEILDMPRFCPQFNFCTIPSCLLMSFQTHSWVFPHTSLFHHSHSSPNSCTGPSQQLLLQEPAPLPLLVYSQLPHFVSQHLTHSNQPHFQSCLPSSHQCLWQLRVLLMLVFLHHLQFKPCQPALFRAWSP